MPDDTSVPGRLPSTVPADVADIGAWDLEADVVVVGLGASGACAALGATESGADVLVLEASGGAGGTSAMSGGLIYLGGGTPIQRPAVTRTPPTTCSAS